MAPPYVPQSVLVRLVWSTGGVDTAVNVLGALNPQNVAVGQALADTLSAAIKLAFTASGWASECHTTTSLARVGVRAYDQPGRPEYIGTGGPIPGSGVGTKLLPPQTALCVTLRTAEAGKSARGRVYLGGMADNALDISGAAVSTAGSSAAGFVQAVHTAFNSSQLQAAVLSRKQGIGRVVTSQQTRDLVFDTIRGRAKPGI